MLFQEEEEEEEGYPYPIGPLPQEIFNDLKSLDEMVRSNRCYACVHFMYIQNKLIELEGFFVCATSITISCLILLYKVERFFCLKLNISKIAGLNWLYYLCKLYSLLNYFLTPFRCFLEARGKAFLKV